MDDLQRALGALRAADAAGNTEDAQRLAGLVRRLQQQPAQSETPPAEVQSPYQEPQGVVENLLEGPKQLLVGAKQANSGFYNTIGNAADLVAKGSDALFGDTMLTRGAKSAGETLHGFADRVAPKPEEIGDSLPAKINQAIGAAPVTVGEYAIANAAGGPVGMAALGGLEQADKGPYEALVGATKAGLGGAMLRGTANLTTPAQMVTQGAFSGATAAAEGGDAKDIAASAITGAGLAATTPGGKTTLKEAAKDAAGPVRRLVSPTARAEEALASDRNAPIRAEIVKDLQGVREGQVAKDQPLQVKQLNQIEKGYVKPVEDALRGLKIPEGDKAQIKDALQRRYTITEGELESITGIPQVGPAATDAIRKVQLFREMTAQEQSSANPVLKIARGAVDLAPLPNPIRYGVRHMLSGGKTRQQVVNDDLLSPRNIRTQDAVLEQAPRDNPGTALQEQVKSTQDARLANIEARQKAVEALRNLNQQQGKDVLGGSLAETEKHTGYSQSEIRAKIDQLRQTNPELAPVLDDLAANKYTKGLYDFQNFLGRKEPQSTTDVTGGSGVRNPIAYQATVENAMAATGSARTAAPDEAMRGVVTRIAAAKDPTEKMRLYMEAAKENPQHAQWLYDAVEPLTKFGKKTDKGHLAMLALPLAGGGALVGQGDGDRPKGALKSGVTPASFAEQLMNRGFSRNAAIGIAANAAHEAGGSNGTSPLNFGAIGDGGHASGVLQWNGPRQRALKAFADKQGGDWRDPNVQLAFLDHELATGYKGLREKMNRAATPEEAARIFVKEFERPADMPTNLRVRAETAKYLASLRNKREA